MGPPDAKLSVILLRRCLWCRSHLAGAQATTQCPRPSQMLLSRSSRASMARHMEMWKGPYAQTCPESCPLPCLLLCLLQYSLLTVSQCHYELGYYVQLHAGKSRQLSPAISVSPHTFHNGMPLTTLAKSIPCPKYRNSHTSALQITDQEGIQFKSNQSQFSIAMHLCPRDTTSTFSAAAARASATSRLFQHSIKSCRC